MAHEYDDENRAYEDTIRSMVLVDEGADDQFVIKYLGAILGTFSDSIEACDWARAYATNHGVKWDVTLQARNAADMA